LEKQALEIRHLQRTEVNEVKEPFSNKQKGSSAMPHKKNPINSENITGLTRVLRGYMLTAYENIALWHERDISHSSAERIIIADSTTLIDYMFNRFVNVIENLFVDEEQMLKNIYLTKGIIFSQRVLTKLIDAGLSREEAYDLIQILANQAYNDNTSFVEIVKKNSLINEVLKESEISELFKLDFYSKKVNYIYKKVFSNN
jgi:adenylosuccinate lyase